MNTNLEAVVSLLELLVKKAGFDVNKDYSEVELQKTKTSISELIKEKNTSNNKKALSSIIENLKVRQANWENNAEIVGKSLLKAYEEGKDYTSVKARIDLLGNLAVKGTEDISVSFLYDRIKTLDNEYNELLKKIEESDYKNENEREMDLRYKTYLENKIDSLESEIDSLNAELEGLREVELKDVNIVAKIKEYISRLEVDKEKLDKAVNSSINSDVAFDVWERLETVKNDTLEKLEKAEELLVKTEEMLDNVRKTRINLNERKNNLEDEKSKCNTKLNNVNTKLENDEYENTTERMIDINNSEKMRLELESLRNKKDVIYVDALKVKEELIKEWSKERDTSSLVKTPELIKEEELALEKHEEDTSVQPPEETKVLEETVVEEAKQEEKKIEKKNKVELDW